MEKLQTRTEHSRSLEDAETFRALDTLKRVGLLIPIEEIETYHGRLGSTAEESEWGVVPSFANANNDSGNYNVNGRPTLYTGEHDVASDFTDARAKDAVRESYAAEFEKRVADYTSEQRTEWLSRLNTKQTARWNNLTPEQQKNYQSWANPLTENELSLPNRISIEARELAERTPLEERQVVWDRAKTGFRAEVHDIVSSDLDATVVNLDFKDSDLSETDKAQYNDALASILVRLTEGSPVGFDERGAIKPIGAAIVAMKKTFITSGDIASIAAAASAAENIVLQLSGAYNALQVSRISPTFLASEYIAHGEDIALSKTIIEGKEVTVPINNEYVAQYFRAMHIVGAKQRIDSITLGKEITSVSLFDLERTFSKEQLDRRKNSMWRKLGSLATTFDNKLGVEAQNTKTPLIASLENVHIKPEELITLAKELDGYGEIFDADAGNWEGFTLAEHTESVLRNFDENFADEIPVQLLPVMRLAILGHDTGKPKAAARGDKHNQKQYNLVQAEDFFTKAGINEKEKGLLLAMIGDGEDLSFLINVLGAGEDVKQQMRSHATKTLQEFYSREDISESEIDSFTEMCRILQVCDGGAYTSMAVTNRAGVGRFRNAPSFNSTYAQPVGPIRRGIKIREAGERSASHSLTPKA